MRTIGILLIVVALAIAVVPVFNNCAYQGKAIALPNGKTVAMKCLWTSRAGLVVGASLGVVGLLLALSKRRETRMFLSIVAGVLSAFAALLPTSIIGVCAMNTLCVTVLRPTMILAGLLGMALAIAAFVIALRSEDALPMTMEGTPA